jgi:hypothetical protein
MSAALITIETDDKTYLLSIRVKEPGTDPLAMFVHAGFRQLCDDKPEIMEAKTITIRAVITP